MSTTDLTGKKGRFFAQGIQEKKPQRKGGEFLKGFMKTMAAMFSEEGAEGQQARSGTDPLPEEKNLSKNESTVSNTADKSKAKILSVIISPEEMDLQFEPKNLETQSNDTLQKFLNNNNDEGDLTMENLIKDLFILRLKNRTAREELGKFTMLSWADSVPYYKYKMNIFRLVRKDAFNELDENDPSSIIELVTKFSAHPAVVEPKDPQERYRAKTLTMIKSAVSTLEEVDGINTFVRFINENDFFPFVTKKVNLEKKEFSEDWISIIHEKAVEIAERDFKMCLFPPKNTDANIVHKNTKDAETIISRQILSPEDSNRFIEQFLPVLDLNIKFFHANSLDSLEIGKFFTNAMEIRDNLKRKFDQNLAIIEDQKKEKEQQVAATNSLDGKTGAMEDGNDTGAIVLEAGENENTTATANEVVAETTPSVEESKTVEEIQQTIVEDPADAIKRRAQMTDGKERPPLKINVIQGNHAVEKVVA